MAPKRKAKGTAPVTTGTLEPALKSQAIFPGKTGEFEIFVKDGSPLLETANWKIYVAKGPSGQYGLMKIATAAEHNAPLQQENRILNTLQEVAQQIDDESAAKEELFAPFYGAGFPKVLEAVDADGRVALFMGYHPSISTYKQFVPLTVALGETKRVDMKTATWMLGKILKSLGFVHDLGFTIGLIDETNVMIETELHGLFVLDFSGAEEDASENRQRAEVKAVAELIWRTVGGSESNPPHDSDIMSIEHHGEFVEFFNRIREGHHEGATAESAALYSLADRIWPKKPIPGTDRSKRDFHNFRLLDK